MREWALEKDITEINSMKRKLVMLASGVMFQYGVRFSNVGHDSQNKGKHSIRRSDVVFEVVSNRRFPILDYVAF